jgi:hypothetical protein
MLGGFTKGKEKEGREKNEAGARGMVISISGKWEQSRLPTGNGFREIEFFLTRSSL